MGNLINCPECGKEISSKAKKLVHCGYPLERMNKNAPKDEINISVGLILYKNYKNDLRSHLELSTMGL